MRRRKFLQTTAAATTLLGSGFHLGHQARRVGLIGTGWYGKVDLLHLLQVEPVEVVSVCDVDSQKVTEAAELFQSRHKFGNRPAEFSDFREQLAEIQHDLIIVGTPDHWHAIPAIEAMKSGADVYCEKPTACDVLESKAMLDHARRMGRKLQIGTQRRRIPHILAAKQQIVQEGLLGDIGMVEMCCYYHMRNRNTVAQSPDEKPPTNLDYEAWTGPAPMRAYNNIVHPRGWRAFMEYGNGIVGDMCVHVFDMVRYLLDLDWPDSINSSGGILVDTEARANITDTQLVQFNYDDLTLSWNHRTWGDAPDPEYQWGAVIYGSKGTLKIDFTKFEFKLRGSGKTVKEQSQADLANFPQDQEDNEKWSVDLIGGLGSRNLMKDWLDSIDNDRLPVADIEQAHISSACCILGNLSLKLGRTLNWDPATHTVQRDPEANQLLK